jgi:hypothetical protein
MTGLFGFAGWLIWRWAGRMPVPVYTENSVHGEQRRPLPSAASPARGLASSLLLAAFTLVGWLPVAGLVELVVGERPALTHFNSGSRQSILGQFQRLYEPPVPAVLVNSLILGLEVACATIVVAWLRGSFRGFARSRSPAIRVAGRLALAHPLVQGIGFLALPWLAGLAASALADSRQLRPQSVMLAHVATELDRFRNPWMMMSFCVALSLVPRLLVLWQGEPRIVRLRVPRDSALDAARLAGGGRARGEWLSEVLPRGHWLAGCVLAGSLAATNVVPALLFEPWVDVQTIGPAVLYFAASPVESRGRAALLALCAIATNLGGLSFVWLSSALPRRVDID